MSTLVSSVNDAHSRQGLCWRSHADWLLKAAPMACLAIVFVLSLAATPRRTGDAQQYLTMAMQLADLAPPSLSGADELHVRLWFQAQPAASGFPDGAAALRQPSLVRGERQEFSHFWLYSLLAAPIVAVTNAAGAHPVLAFTLLNAALLAAALGAIVSSFGPLPALLFISSPLIWFVGRAQAEVFTVSLLGLAMAAAATRRWGWASRAVAFASTQNAPIAAAIPVFWAAGAADWASSRRVHGCPITFDKPMLFRHAAFAVAGAVIALLHPAYYLVRLGVLTPQQLNGGIAGKLPSWQRLLAPLLDPDIGFLPWLPVVSLLAVAGTVIAVAATLRSTVGRTQSLLPLICALIMAGWFLVVFAQTTNVNSGGTVHVSRYALWLLPLTLPALAVAASAIQERIPGAALVGALLLFGVYLGYFRPDQPERYVEHSPQATWLAAHLPSLYRPLPEIFVERTLHVDGGAHASAATPDCRLILLIEQDQDQPCPLSPANRAAIDELLIEAPAVWVARGEGGDSRVIPVQSVS